MPEPTPAEIDAARAEAARLFDDVQASPNMSPRERGYYRQWYIAGYVDAKWPPENIEKGA